MYQSTIELIILPFGPFIQIFKTKSQTKTVLAVIKMTHKLDKQTQNNEHRCDMKALQKELLEQG
jgi:ERCC4-type nuclease